MTGEIIVKNQSKRSVEIRIEGIIGVPEGAQFDDPQARVATYETFQRALNDIRQIKAKTVVVQIRSTGGNVNDALLIHDALRELEGEVVTRCHGYVASAATIIAQAASAGRREISPNALYLIHRASTGAEGNAGELSQTADLLDKTDQRIARIYAEASGREVENFTTLMHENGGNGRWLSPQEAVEAGLADKIIGSGRIKNTLRVLFNRGSEKLPVPPPDIPGDCHPEHSAAKSENLENEAKEAMPQNEIEDLQNRIAELEALNAKLRAQATRTEPKEDPTNREIRRMGNAAAYENDLQKLKTL